MGYSISYNSGTTTPFGTYKQGTITMGLKPDEYTVSSGFTWYANAEYTNDAYLIISDTYSQGWSTQAEAKPTIWRSETGTTESFVSLVNQLPDVNGVTGFTGSGEAMGYLQSTGKYFVSKDDYLGIVSDGLVLNLDAGWYPSYSGSGTTWKDIKGSNNGTLTNGPTFDSGNGGSIVFDGTNDYIRIVLPSSISVSSFSYNIWFNAGVVNNGYRTLIDLNNDRFLITIKPDGQLSLWSPTFNLGFAPSINTWYNIQVTHNYNNPYYTYINGTLVGTYSSSQTTTHTVCSIGVGAGFITGTCGNKNPDEFFNGKIAIASMYNRGLTPSEVLQNYNAQKGRFGL